MCTNHIPYNAKDIEKHVYSVFLEVLTYEIRTYYVLQRKYHKQYNTNVACHLLRIEICFLCNCFTFKTPWSLLKSYSINSNKKISIIEPSSISQCWKLQSGLNLQIKIRKANFTRILTSPRYFFPPTRWLNKRAKGLWIILQKWGFLLFLPLDCFDRGRPRVTQLFIFKLWRHSQYSCWTTCDAEDWCLEVVLLDQRCRSSI